MNILFLTINYYESISHRGIYTDLIRKLKDCNNNIYMVMASENSYVENYGVYNENGIKKLGVKTGRLFNCGLIEKGISTILINKHFIKAIKKHLYNVKFDVVLYATPPITFVNTVKYIKRRDNAKSYLMLKDIFPQNAVDLGMMSTNSPIYKYFRNKEKKLYNISDKIGCMSEANVDYVLKHNPYIPKEKVEVFPNAIEFRDLRLNQKEKSEIRKKYDLPLDKTIYVYGGNLGKPQGIPFIIECLEKIKDNDKAYFLIVGDGTEYNKLEEYINNSKSNNVKLMKRLPKEDYDRMIASCDVGLIFLDYRFTIPNFPSRLLSYMQAGLPVLASTDPNTDIGKVITDNKIGWHCLSNNPIKFKEIIETITQEQINQYGNGSIEYLKEKYDVKKCTL